MKAKSFELNDLNDYRLFYKLNKFSGFDIFEIYHQQVGGREAFDDYMVLNLFGHLVVAIPDQFKHTGKYNLIASDGHKEEIINLHPFERVWEIYKTGHTETNPGTFNFLNSLPVSDEKRQWRCDYNLYGPEVFRDPLGNIPFEIPENISGLLVYEPLLSINGVGYIDYDVHDVETERKAAMLEAYTPYSSVTFGGIVKLITEWSRVSESPFNNTEEIATIARKFCEDLGITEDLVANQPDMQIFKYLNGDQNARSEPNPEMFSQELDIFLKKNMAHSSLSSILLIYPEIQLDINTILNIELNLVDDDVISFLQPLVKDESIHLNNRQEVLHYLDNTYNNAGLSGFSRLKLSFLDTKKKLLNQIKNTRKL